MEEREEVDVERLRARIERALQRNDAASTALATHLLEKLLGLVPAGSADAAATHRQLAELRAESAPWKAALHLRAALQVNPGDDALHAMMGLSQALLGNYRAAVAAYGRAVRCAPSIGWYHHNLGHLLDVALDDPKRAEAPLRAAVRLAPDHDEVVASLAHCLARVGQKAEALELAKRARVQKPNKPAHRELVAWIEADGVEPRAAAQGDRQREVADAFDAQMRAVGYADPMIAGAHRLWGDFARGRALRVVKTAVYAAAVEYAMASLTRWPGASQASVARRYGVSPGAVSTRVAELREALGLRSFDPRYVSKS